MRAATVLALLLATAPTLACPATSPREPELALPADIATLPLFDPAAHTPDAPTWGAAEAPLAVTEFSPRGRQSTVRALTLRFNQPVAPHDLAAAAPPLRIDPPLPGRPRWRAPDELIYELDADPAPATRYSVQLPGPLRSRAGQPLQGTPTWTFETTPPDILRVTPGPDDEHPTGAPIILEFDQPLTAASLAALLTATAHPRRPGGEKTDPNAPPTRTTPGTKLPFTVRPATVRDLLSAGREHQDPEPTTIFAVRPAPRWPAARDIDLHLRAGLQGAAGPLPTDTTWSTTFATPHPPTLLSRTCTETTPCGHAEDPTFRFRNPLSEDPPSTKNITLTPRPEFLNIYTSGTDLIVSASYATDTVYTIKLHGLEDIHGQPVPPSTHRAHFIHKADLRLSATTGVLPTDRPHLGLESHFVRAVRVKVGLYDERELAAVDRLDTKLHPTLGELPFPARTHEQLLQLGPRDATMWASHALDLAALTATLRPASPALRGAVLVEVTPVDLVDTDRRGRPDPVRSLIRVTDLALLAHASRPTTAVRALHLSSGTAGTPAPGVEVCQLGPDPKTTTCAPLGATDPHGLLRAAVRLPTRDHDDSTPPERVRLVAHDPATGDRAHLDLAAPSHDAPTRTTHPRPGERLRGRILRERGAYRPGERVHLVGWAALDTPYTRHNLAPLPRNTPVELTLRGPDRQVTARATARLTAAGKFSATLALPPGAALGRYTARAELASGSLETTLLVADYRTPEFAVTATPHRTDLLVDEPAVVDIDAAYYFGAPVAQTTTTWTATCRPFRYTPPNLPPDWHVGADPPTSHRTTEPLSIPPTRADPPGRRTLHAAPSVASPHHPHRCTYNFFAQDASAQGVGADAQLTVHPAPLYLAVAPPRAAHRGDTLKIPLRALTRDGDRVAARGVRLDITRVWTEPVLSEQDGVRWQSSTRTHHDPLPPCTVDLTAAGPDATCELTAGPTGSTYELTASNRIDAREARTTTSFLITARPDQLPPRPPLAPPSTLELRLATTTVSPGDPLDITLRAPWPGAVGHLVVARRGVRDVHPFTIQPDETHLRLIADDTWTPGLELTAHVVAPGRHNLAAHHSAFAQVHQDAEHRRLHVTVDAPREAGPGDSLPLTIKIRDAADRPLAARVAVWAVDEAVLALTDERMPDLLAHFIPSHAREVDDHDLLRDLRVPYTATSIDPDRIPRGRTTRVPQVRQARAEVQGATDPKNSPSDARSRFLTTPLFLADVAADTTGTARVTVPLPDNLTTYRLTAVASADLEHTRTPGRFGAAETRVVVTAPLTVRAAAPRQLRPGDISEVAALVDNRTDHPGRVDVAALLHTTSPEGHVPSNMSQRPSPTPATTNSPALELLSPATGTVDIPAHGQARVAFQVRARGVADTQLELRARLTPAQGAQTFTDAIRVPLPVAAEPTQVDRVAIHGELTSDRAVQIPIKLPEGALPAIGGLTLQTSTSQVADLEDAARALLDYPHGCLEQTASRLLPLIALGARELSVPPEFLTTTLTRLARMQTASGGFSYWPGDPHVHLYASAYTTWLLQQARTAGLELPDGLLSAALVHLDTHVRTVDLDAVSTALLPDVAAPLALALHALADADFVRPEVPFDEVAAALFARRHSLPIFTRATLLLALHRRNFNFDNPAVTTLTDELLANLSEGPEGAHAREHLAYSMDTHFHSDTRTDALVLLALLKTRPDHPSLKSLARGLQSRRPGGTWRSTQENAHAILALSAWARVHEPADPALRTRVWLAGRNVLDVPQHTRASITTTHTPMLDLLALSHKPDTPLPLVVHREGTGPLYYRVAVDWAAAGDPPAREQGITIRRKIRDAGSIDLGEPVAVDLELLTHHALHYVAIEVPIPAGLEPVHHNLGRGHAAATQRGAAGNFLNHQELRHDRVVLFADHLQPGHHTHTIHLRATSRGRYLFPPAHAEAMYIPEVHGRTTTATLTVR